MKLPVACLAAILCLYPAAPASAQTEKKSARESLRDRAIKRCKENRGTDCESRQGLREWLREEQPITDAERQAAAASRQHREQCAKTKGGAGC
jgi:hypothetical protein